MKIALAPAGPFHGPLIAALHGACFPAPDDAWSADAVTAVLGNPGGFGQLAAHGESPAGFVLARVVADESEILALGVLEAFRGSGVGRALVAAASSESRRRGARALFLEAAEDNAPAQGLYRSAGFVAVGRRPRYYPRVGSAPVAAVIWRWDLVCATRMRSR